MMADEASDPVGARPILLDTVCLINLLATRHVEAILRASTESFGVAERVVAEAGYLEPGPDDGEVRQKIEIEPLVASGVLELLRLETEPEHESYVDLIAAELGGGEAMTIALAVHRGYDIATDDRGAARFVREEYPHLKVWSTLVLVKNWAETQGIAYAVLGRVLKDIRTRARWRPGPRHPLWDWWKAAVDQC